MKKQADADQAKVLKTGNGCLIQDSRGSLLIGLAKGHLCVSNSQ